jgi:hypothetical protein
MLDLGNTNPPGKPSGPPDAQFLLEVYSALAPACQSPLPNIIGAGLWRERRGVVQEKTDRGRDEHENDDDPCGNDFPE